MKINNPELKHLIMQLINFEDSVDKDSKQKRREFYPKAFAKGTMEAYTKIVETMEFGVLSDERDNDLFLDKLSALKPSDSWKAEALKLIEEMKDIYKPSIPEWLPVKDFKMPVGKRIYAERQTDQEIELSDAAIKAIKHYYDEASELPRATMEALNLLEDLIK